MIFDHYLTVRPWVLEFEASTTTMDKTLVWVRFRGLGMVYYDGSMLLTIASAIGAPIKVDQNTLNMNRGRFARVCVQINLNVPIEGKFNLNGSWYKVEYEGPHVLCVACRCYGHVARACPTIPLSQLIADSQETQSKQGVGVTPNPNHNMEKVSQLAIEFDDVATHEEWMVVKHKPRKNETNQKTPIMGNIFIQNIWAKGATTQYNNVILLDVMQP